MSLVYQHIRKDNHEVFYVGVGKSEKRAYEKVGRNRHWHNIVNKHGYYVEIIYPNLTNELAWNMEKALIKAYGRYDLGLGQLVNMTDGGDGIENQIVSEEHKAKISLANTGKKRSEETKKLMSDKRKQAGISGFNHFKAKAVINLETGIFYGSKNEAAKAYNINPRTLRSYLDGERPNKTSMIYA